MEAIGGVASILGICQVVAESAICVVQLVVQLYKAPAEVKRLQVLEHRMTRRQSASDG